jgi:hypothetical protein
MGQEGRGGGFDALWAHVRVGAGAHLDEVLARDKLALEEGLVRQRRDEVAAVQLLEQAVQGIKVAAAAGRAHAQGSAAGGRQRQPRPRVRVTRVTHRSCRCRCRVPQLPASI